MLNHCRPQQSAHCPSLWGGCWGRCTPITGHRLSHRCEELRAVRPLGLVSQIPIHPTNNSGRPGPRHRHRHMQSVPMFTSDCLPPQPPHCHQPVCPVCGNWWTVGANAAAAGARRADQCSETLGQEPCPALDTRTVEPVPRAAGSLPPSLQPTNPPPKDTKNSKMQVGPKSSRVKQSLTEISWTAPTLPVLRPPIMGLPAWVCCKGSGRPVQRLQDPVN